MQLSELHLGTKVLSGIGSKQLNRKTLHVLGTFHRRLLTSDPSSEERVLSTNPPCHYGQLNPHSYQLTKRNQYTTHTSNRKDNFEKFLGSSSRASGKYYRVIESRAIALPPLEGSCPDPMWAGYSLEVAWDGIFPTTELRFRLGVSSARYTPMFRISSFKFSRSFEEFWEDCEKGIVGIRGGETLRGSNESQRVVETATSPATRGEENYDNLRTQCPPSSSPPCWPANSRGYPSQGSETDKEKGYVAALRATKTRTDDNARVYRFPRLRPSSAVDDQREEREDKSGRRRQGTIGEAGGPLLATTPYLTGGTYRSDSLREEWEYGGEKALQVGDEREQEVCVVGETERERQRGSEQRGQTLEEDRASRDRKPVQPNTATIRRTGKRSGRLRGRMSTCTDEADNAPLHMQEALSPPSAGVSPDLEQSLTASRPINCYYQPVLACKQRLGSARNTAAPSTSPPTPFADPNTIFQRFQVMDLENFRENSSFPLDQVQRSFELTRFGKFKLETAAKREVGLGARLLRDDEWGLGIRKKQTPRRKETQEHGPGIFRDASAFEWRCLRAIRGLNPAAGVGPGVVSEMKVQEGPVSPASSSLSNQNQNESEQQVLLATMQPVNVLDLHEPPAVHSLHPKYHHHHHRHHHHHHHHHHQQQQHIQPDPDDVQQRTTDDPDGRVTPGADAAAANSTLGVGEHKMIDLIYNDGQKTVMYTHDKEIIYENEADRVQVVEYPPPPPSPPSPSPPSAVTRAGLLPPTCVTPRHQDIVYLYFPPVLAEWSIGILRLTRQANVTRKTANPDVLSSKLQARLHPVFAGLAAELARQLAGTTGLQLAISQTILIVLEMDARSSSPAGKELQLVVAVVSLCCLRPVRTNAEIREGKEAARSASVRACTRRVQEKSHSGDMPANLEIGHA
ncbi:hypothetical protein WN48_08984 [Eufriesea mexicana]|uniref:Uncharacterized protein n=1 Tax=Eufriesea mexicana TaxID=516756 RepID=A0A310SIN4_9HYME|nr:hypothetical protein WN48_08984 [Eufriesea mexicana]